MAKKKKGKVKFSPLPVSAVFATHVADLGTPLSSSKAAAKQGQGQSVGEGCSESVCSEGDVLVLAASHSPLPLSSDTIGSCDSYTQSDEEEAAAEVVVESANRGENSAHKVFAKIPQRAETSSSNGDKCPPTKPSFAGLFKHNRDASDDDLNLQYYEEFYHENGQDVKLLATDLVNVEEQFGFVLVGHFTGRFPGLKAVHDIKNSWKVACTVTPHVKGWVIFRFKSLKDRQFVERGGPYCAFGKTLILRSLSPGFAFDETTFLVVPLWINLPRLPLECWKKEALGKIVSKVGRPIRVDKVTKDRSKLAYARILCEVDASKEPLEIIPVELPCGYKFEQEVVYETFPDYCWECETYGHNIFECEPLEEVKPNSDPKAKVSKQSVSEAEAAPCVVIEVQDLNCAMVCESPNTSQSMDGLGNDKGGKCSLNKGEGKRPRSPNILPKGGQTKGVKAAASKPYTPGNVTNQWNAKAGGGAVRDSLGSNKTTGQPAVTKAKEPSKKDIVASPSSSCGLNIAEITDMTNNPFDCLRQSFYLT